MTAVRKVPGFGASEIVTGPWGTGMGPEHLPTGTTTELPGIVVKGGLAMKVKFPVTGFVLDDDLQISMNASHGACSVAGNMPVASKKVTLVIFDLLFVKDPQEEAITCTVTVHVIIKELSVPLLKVNMFGCVELAGEITPVPELQVVLNDPGT